jgi:RNA polymerase sigma-70 factor (ECF subfamily)
MEWSVEAIRNGDKEAIRAFYRDFAPRISRFLARKVPPEDAKEILNDVFFDAIDQLPFLKNTDNIQAWLYRIAHNKSVDYYRKKKIKSLLLSQVPYLEIVAKEFEEPEFIMEKNRVREKIEKALQMISVKYAIILRMHYEDGMRIKEIAVNLNLTPKATESLLFRARVGFMKAYERA